MHIAALIFALFGAGGGAAFAMKWISDYNDAKGIRDLASALSGGKNADVVKLDHLHNTALVWLAVCVVGLVGGALALRRKGKPGAGLLLVAAAVPAAMEPITLITGFFFIIAALLAFFVKPKPAAAAATP